MAVEFAWDAGKNDLNMLKHGVSFEEARSVFLDENAVEFFDEDHSDREDRYLMLGMSNKYRHLLVAYTTRKTGTHIVIRLISARKATK